MKPECPQEPPATKRRGKQQTRAIRISYAPLPAAVAAAVTLDQLPKQARARITALLPSADFGNLDGLVTVRLKELGFLPGAELSVVGFGLFGGDPIAVRLGSSKFALRTAEARKVEVSPLTEGA